MIKMIISLLNSSGYDINLALLFSLFPGNQFALCIVTSATSGLSNDTFPLPQALPSSIGTIITDNPSKPWYNYCIYIRDGQFHFRYSDSAHFSSI